MVQMKKGIASLMAAFYCALILLGSSPHAHEALHEDSHSASHVCALTILSDGGIDCAPPASILQLEIVSSLASVPRPLFLPSISVGNAFRERAPPVSL